MSKRHQASRRRSYGRRQHELHERPVVRPAVLDPERADDLVEAVVARYAPDAAGRFGFGYAD